MKNHFFHNKEEIELVPEYALLGPRKIAGRKFFVLVRRETFAWERANAFLFYQLFVPVAVWDQRAFFQLEEARGLEGYLQELKKKWRDDVC